MAAYDTTTPLGAYLSKRHHFNPNGLVCYMSLERLEAVVDSSGQYENLTDTLLTVNGCLGTTDGWIEFDLEWQNYLKEVGFKRHHRSQQYTFHTTDFWADDDPRMPKGLDYYKKDEIYRDLLKIVRKHAVYTFGYAVILEHYRSIDSEFPDHTLKHPGIMLSKKFFHFNSEWAKTNGFASDVSYTYDQNDKYFPALKEEWKEVLKWNPEDVSMVFDITEAYSWKYSPLQAADIIASENRQYYLHTGS